MFKQLLVIGLIVLSCQGQEVDVDGTVKYWAAVARGSLQGFERGFYNKPSFVINELCLGKSACTQMENLYSAYITGAIINIFKTASSLY